MTHLPDDVMKALGLTGFHKLFDIDGHPFHPEDDDCPGSALFVVRGLKWLAVKRQNVTRLKLHPEHDPEVLAFGQYGNLPVQRVGATMAKAVYDAICEVCNV